MIREQLAEHRDEAVDRVGGLAVGSGQPANRVVGAIHLVAAIDQKERRTRGHQTILFDSASRLRAGADRRPGVDRLRQRHRQKIRIRRRYFLALDGSAIVYVNASVPALVALRGVSLPLDPHARLDRAVVRDIYDTPVSSVASVTTSRREGRRYVHLRIDVADVRRLGDAAAVRLVNLSLQRGRHLRVRAAHAGLGRKRWATSAGAAMSSSPCACTCRARSSTTTRRREESTRQHHCVGTAAGRSASRARRSTSRRGWKRNRSCSTPSPSSARWACWSCSRSSPPSGSSNRASQRLSPLSPQSQPLFRVSIDSRTSASVFSSFFNSNSPKPEASERASIRSTLLCTTPSSVTRPRLTTTRIGGLAIAA